MNPCPQFSPSVAARPPLWKPGAFYNDCGCVDGDTRLWLDNHGEALSAQRTHSRFNSGPQSPI